ncbi:MAG: PhoH family protein [Rhodospirillaceae bacterium]|nr:PhoH family protein [Rhodospirillaceae bacterium]
MTADTVTGHVLRFDDNRLLQELVGPHNSHLARMDAQLGVTTAFRGNQLTVSGEEAAVELADRALRRLWRRLQQGQPLGHREVDAAVRLVRDGPARAEPSPQEAIRTRFGAIEAQSAGQLDFIRAMASHSLVFGLGPAGTGKTFLAAAQAVSLLTNNPARGIRRIVLTRPAVEAGERLGFLPGDLKEKVNPYLRPIYDALDKLMPADQRDRYLANETIEVAPIAFMRGRTLDNAFVIVDEAQNITIMQMRMLLTRLGENGVMVVNGDPTQVDLPPGTPSGLLDAVGLLEGLEDIAVVRLTDGDVVRSDLVARVVRAYERREAARAAAGREGKP